MLATGSRVRGFKPGRYDGFLMTIKISRTPSSERKLTRRPHVVIFYGMLKKLA
jgi:hypothetical protein